ncbi:peptidoglycan editing factor PgeF [Thiorhodovibrio winogradskyi]|nr:peptidoglycan editing factor PgeF [Thiorhodovibrio winogradskyi]
MSPGLELLYPDWSVSQRVRACTTTRGGGTSTGAYAGLNLATHVGDDPARVAANRQLLAAALGLPSDPVWLEQVHGIEVLEIGETTEGVEAIGGEQAIPCADSSLTHRLDRVCAVLTADCLPLLLCERQGRAVAAVHAGWRGLLAGVIEQTVARLAESPEKIAAWLGPAIGQDAFEVGPEVRAAFVAADAQATLAFKPSPGARWLADLYTLARQRLRQTGVNDISGGHHCTFTDQERFYSYRRDGRTGRMATLIWLDSTISAT